MAHGRRVIYAALIGNSLIAVTKFVATGITGSSAMMSEAIHSVVDTGNQLLLLYGLRRASRPADRRHPFGYGSEIYFWAFVVAIMLFAIGSGVSLYEGYRKISDPHAIESPIINYVVLVLAMIFEAVAWYYAYRAFKRSKGTLGWVEAVRVSKDPTVFTVLFEDTAAILGLIAALVGIWGAVTFDMPWLDGAASMVIGLILAVAAILLAIETKGLLIGEAASPEIEDGIRELVKQTPVIAAINELRTLHRGPDDILVTISVDFRDGVLSQEVEASIQKLDGAIRSKVPEARRLFIEVQSASGHRQSQAARAEPGAGPAG